MSQIEVFMSCIFFIRSLKTTAVSSSIMCLCFFKLVRIWAYQTSADVNFTSGRLYTVLGWGTVTAVERRNVSFRIQLTSNFGKMRINGRTASWTRQKVTEVSSHGSVKFPVKIHNAARFLVWGQTTAKLLRTPQLCYRYKTFLLFRD